MVTSWAIIRSPAGIDELYVGYITFRGPAADLLIKILLLWTSELCFWMNFVLHTRPLRDFWELVLILILSFLTLSIYLVSALHSIVCDLPRKSRFSCLPLFSEQRRVENNFLNLRRPGFESSHEGMVKLVFSIPSTSEPYSIFLRRQYTCLVFHIVFLK